MRTVRVEEFKAIGFGMTGLVIGLLLLFFWSHDRTGTRPRDEDTCCKEVQVQEKTGVTTTLIPYPAKSLIARSEMSSESYCVITSCKTITFSSIFWSDSGQIGSCLSVFQDRCPSPSPGSRRSIDLVFKSARFPSNKLTKSWINLSPSVNLAVESIRFEDCQLDKIEPEAFLSDLFITTRNLQLVNTKLSVLNKSVFKELSNLRNFAVQNNIINAAERHLLSNVAETLETIELDRSIDNLAVLLNITSSRISPSPRPDSNSSRSLILGNEPTKERQLSNVQLVSLQGNNIPILSKEIFSSFPNLKSLYLDSSKITHINFDTFDACKSLKQIFLTNNLLSTLPDNIFTKLLTANPDFKVTMTNNPWQCDCKFIWIQKFLMKAPNLVTEMPKCLGPDRNRNLSFLDADFCGNSSTDTTEIINSNNSLIKIICNNSLDLIEINLSKTKLEAMGAEEGNISSGGFNCVCKSILIKNNNNNDDDGCKKNLWLSNEDKAIVLSLYTIVSVLFGLGCAGGCFFIVRNNPSLLRGSSRVVMVKHGGVEAMVLPRGVRVGNLATGSGEPVKFEMRDNCEIDYLTPIGIAANEYESIRDAGGAREESGIDNCPPPLPPHPLHGVRTVSLLMAESESSLSGF
ncbi:uncharacterized protein LOC130665032 [Microplitis mediator]|uniref:uncharacterized protein LOC130665032 n=1 Tax=Microplitis mediator TaxID=375433 RepID=UPI002556B631|nr:uncharacterized protein LOC130665032 [Microplitis mediator]